MLVVVFIIFVLSGMLNSALSKKFQQSFSADFTHFISYNFVNAAFACVYFFIASGFSFKANFTTFLFAVLFALVVIASVVLGILSLSVTSIAIRGIVTTAGSTVLPSLFGILVLNEPSSLILYLSLILLVAASLIPNLPLKKSNSGFAPLIFSLLFLVSGLAVIVEKLYILTPGVVSSATFFLLTNVVTFLICGTVLLIKFLIHPHSRKAILKPFSKKQYMNIALQTATSNLSSLMTLFLLSRIDVSVFAIISSSLGILSGAFLSKFVFKEPMLAKNWVAVILVLVSIFLNVQ